MLVYRTNKEVVNNIIGLKYNFIGEEYYSERVLDKDIGIVNNETNELIAIIHITHINRISYYSFAESNGIPEDDLDMFERHIDYKQYGWYFDSLRILKNPIKLNLNGEFAIHNININEKELVFK